jgi:hypothetical protein
VRTLGRKKLFHNTRQAAAIYDYALDLVYPLGSLPEDQWKKLLEARDVAGVVEVLKGAVYGCRLVGGAQPGHKQYLPRLIFQAIHEQDFPKKKSKQVRYLAFSAAAEGLSTRKSRKICHDEERRPHGSGTVG